MQLSPGTDDWLIVTGQGYFATSNPAAVQGKTSGFQDAEMVRQTLAGKKPRPRPAMNPREDTEP